MTSELQLSLSNHMDGLIPSEIPCDRSSKTTGTLEMEAKNKVQMEGSVSEVFSSS
jgi:hypothetical protein